MEFVAEHACFFFIFAPFALRMLHRRASITCALLK
jgi:hypothetical protein